jgi:hypothetical protein
MVNRLRHVSDDAGSAAYSGPILETPRGWNAGRAPAPRYPSQAGDFSSPSLGCRVELRARASRAAFPMLAACLRAFSPVTKPTGSSRVAIDTQPPWQAARRFAQRQLARSRAAPRYAQRYGPEMSTWQRRRLLYPAEPSSGTFTSLSGVASLGKRTNRHQRGRYPRGQWNSRSPKRRLSCKQRLISQVGTRSWLSANCASDAAAMNAIDRAPIPFAC